MLQAERLAPEGQQQSANPVDADGLEDDRELTAPSQLCRWAAGARTPVSVVTIRFF